MFKKPHVISLRILIVSFTSRNILAAIKTTFKMLEFLHFYFSINNNI